MKHEFQVIETYWKTIEVSARTKDQAKKLAMEKAKELKLGQKQEKDKSINFAVDILTEEEQPWWEQLQSIAEETNVNWYQQMHPWQRAELSKEELFKYAEEMREALERIFDIANEYERKAYEEN